MPAVSAVPVALAVSALKKYISHFTTDELPAHSSPVGKDISDELQGLWKVPAVRIIVRENRREILTLARTECGIFIHDEDKEHISHNLNDSSNNHDNSDTTHDLSESGNGNDNTEGVEEEGFKKFKSNKRNNENDEIENFEVAITREQWNKIKCDKPLVYKGRKYYGFEPGVWTNIV